MRSHAEWSDRCYRCGLRLPVHDRQRVDLAGPDAAYANIVDMHAACARIDLENRSPAQAFEPGVRRERAVTLRHAGHSQRSIARSLGVSQRTVQQDLLVA